LKRILACACFRLETAATASPISAFPILSCRATFNIFFRRNRPVTEEEKRVEEDIAAGHIKVRNFRNNYLQDREEQKSETFMGPLADSSTEHLGAGDITVIAVRKFMLQAVRALDRGKEPPHIIRTPEQNDMSLSPAW
jgi:hypothetical protein